jgi:hypothetical protein
MHIICTHGTPIVDTLSHLPHLPLFVEYLDGVREVRQSASRGWRRLSRRRKEMTVTASGEDELGIHHALQLRDRVRRVDLRLSLSILRTSLLIMYGPFPILEHLSLSFTGDEVTSLALPKTFLAPNTRHLSLLGIRVPKRLRLLSSTVSLVTLKLTGIRGSGFFRPRLLVARLESLPLLEELSIEFSIPIPRPSTERLLLGKQGTPIALSSLKALNFRGVSAYLEHLLSQIRAPVLKRLNITLFNQIAFRLPHLCHFVKITEQIKFPVTVAVAFNGQTSTNLRHFLMRWDTPNEYAAFTLRVMCQPLDWQIDCATQICSALMPTVSGVESLSLKYDTSESDWASPPKLDFETDGIDGTTWHDLLRSFVGVKELRIDHFLSEVLSLALEVDEIGFDPGFLPDLQELDSAYGGNHSDGLFGSFIHTRQVAGRPVSLRLPPPPRRSPGLFGPRSPRSPLW